MKTISIIPLFLLLLTYPISLSAQPTQPEWKEYVSEKGKFSIRFPGIPTEGYRPVGADSDTSMTYVTNLIIEQRAWTVAYFDLPTLPPANADAKKLFDQTRDKMLKMYSSKLAQEESLTLRGYPVRSFTAKPDDRNRVLCARLYLVGPRVYEIWALAEAGKQKSPEVIAYLDSFKPIPLTEEEFRKAKGAAKPEPMMSVPRKMRVSVGVLQEQAREKVQPLVPAEARTAKIGGIVEVNILVSEEGTVIEAKAVSGPEQLREAAVQAARQWKFRPFLLQNAPIRLEGTLPFQFKVK